MLTNDELNLLKSVTSEKEWGDACDAIKRAHNGYPADWYDKVIISGLMRRVASQWGGDDQIRVVRI